eukprot:12401527-Karenia_brevis.AAC.1
MAAPPNCDAYQQIDPQMAAPNYSWGHRTHWAKSQIFRGGARSPPRVNRTSGVPSAGEKPPSRRHQT